jgi:hypothetical protein
VQPLHAAAAQRLLTQKPLMHCELLAQDPPIGNFGTQWLELSQNAPATQPASLTQVVVQANWPQM